MAKPDHFLTTLTAQPCTIKSTQTETSHTHSYTKRAPSRREQKETGNVFSSVKYKTQLATHTQQTFVDKVFFTSTRTLRFSNTRWEQSLISAACRRGDLSDPGTWNGNEFHKAKNQRGEIERAGRAASPRASEAPGTRRKGGQSQPN